MLKKRTTETALVSDKGNLLMRTEIQIGVAVVVKYGWFTNANRRSDCKFLKDSDAQEWSYLEGKGLLFANIIQDDIAEEEAPVYKERYIVWEKTNTTPWMPMRIFDSKEEADEELKYRIEEHLSSQDFLRKIFPEDKGVHRQFIVLKNTERPDEA